MYCKIHFDIYTKKYRYRFIFDYGSQGLTVIRISPICGKYSTSMEFCINFIMDNNFLHDLIYS